MNTIEIRNRAARNYRDCSWLRWVRGMATVAPFVVAFIAATAHAVCPAHTATLPGEDPASWGQQERLERSGQELIGPWFRGVDYDARRRRVVFSTCRGETFDCTLSQVVLTAADPRVERLDLPNRYGYMWPSLSPDGAHLALVRTRRNQRPSRRVVTQEIVDVDLNTGAQRVLLESGDDGRFERVVYLGPSVIVAVRSFRSSTSVACRGNFCTDVAEVILIRDGHATTLPMRANIHLSGVQIVPIKNRDLFIIRTVRPIGTQSAYSAYLVDPYDASNDQAHERWADQLSYIRQRYGEILDWPREFIDNGTYSLIALPFCGTPAEPSAEHQTHIVSSRLGVSIMKVSRGLHLVGYRISLFENRGRIPWDQIESILVQQ